MRKGPHAEGLQLPHSTSWRDVPVRACHTCHLAGLRLRRELQGSKDSRCESWSPCLGPGLGQRQLETRTPAGRPNPICSWLGTPSYTREIWAKIFSCFWSLYLVAKIHCSNICRNAPFALLFKSRVLPGGSRLNS